jgi:hypothetical protein
MIFDDDESYFMESTKGRVNLRQSSENILFHEGNAISSPDYELKVITVPYCKFRNAVEQRI